jgi:adenine-specific DNA-methyltransferase
LREKTLIEVTGAKLFQSDAFDFLAEVKTGSVDLIVSSPPYFMGKEYDTSLSIDDFKSVHRRLLPELVRILKPGGSLCWQVGHHVRNGVSIPLDAIVYLSFAESDELFLRNRIIWTFGHGVHARRRFSGRHETVLWYTKGSEYYFDLDAVRVPQKYPGKKHYRGPNKGEWSGNPLGKNPSDIWEIPNVNSHHVEKTKHPCQFPVALVQRLVRSLSPIGGTVADPFMGSGTSAVAAVLEKRKFIGCDQKSAYVRLANKRLIELKSGKLKFRPIGQALYVPSDKSAVAQRPPHFATTI